MVLIDAVVESLAVMDERKTLDDVGSRAVVAGETQSVEADAGPVRCAVDAAPVEGEFAS